jgi:hypothetical protein
MNDTGGSDAANGVPSDLSERYSVATEIYLAEDSPSDLHSFSNGVTSFQFAAVNIRVEGVRPLMAVRQLQNCQGFRVEFSDFGSRDEAYEFAARFVSTLTARAAVHDQTSLAGDLNRVDITLSEQLRETLTNSPSPTLQLSPGINVHPALGKRITWVQMGVSVENTRAQPAGEWIRGLVQEPHLIARNRKLELALSAFATACSCPEPELRLLNLFAALEALAGPAPAPADLVRLIDKLQANISKSPDFTDEEQVRLGRLLEGRKSAGQRAGVEKLLREIDNRNDLVEKLNAAYQARNAYAHGASRQDDRRLRDLCAAMEGVLILFVHDRLVKG